MDAQKRSAGRLVADEAGATSIEYALIASVVAIFAISALVGFGTDTGVLFQVIDRIGVAIAGVLGAA